MILRPDERAMLAEKEREKSFRKNVGQGVALASSAIPIAAASKLLPKIMPFLSKYIPEDLALKGIDKISPPLGKFLKSGISQGLALSSGLDYLKDQFSESENKSQERPKEDRNIIQKYSPELFDFMKNQISRNMNPIQAGAIAQNEKKFLPIIKQMSKDYKTSWSDIIKSIFGSGEEALAQQQGMFQQPEMNQQQQILQQQQAQPTQQQLGQAENQSKDNLNNELIQSLQNLLKM